MISEYPIEKEWLNVLREYEYDFFGGEAYALSNIDKIKSDLVDAFDKTCKVLKYAIEDKTHVVCDFDYYNLIKKSADLHFIKTDHFAFWLLLDDFVHNLSKLVDISTKEIHIAYQLRWHFYNVMYGINTERGLDFDCIDEVISNCRLYGKVLENNDPLWIAENEVVNNINNKDFLRECLYRLNSDSLGYMGNIFYPPVAAILYKNFIQKHPDLEDPRSEFCPFAMELNNKYRM
jgi:hypothetical protein